MYTQWLLVGIYQTTIETGSNIGYRLEYIKQPVRLGVTFLGDSQREKLE